MYRFSLNAKISIIDATQSHYLQKHTAAVGWNAIDLLRHFIKRNKKSNNLIKVWFVVESNIERKLLFLALFSIVVDQTKENKSQFFYLFANPE